MVPSEIPNSLAALAPPISLASFTAYTLYSWSYLRATLNTSLFSWFYYEILENKLSTFLYHTISMYAKGMTTRQISETIEDIYGFETSEGFISDVTDKILPQIEDWQNRPLDEVYPILYIDAIHYSVRDNGVIRKLAAYVILGINTEGKKEVLSITV